MSDQKPMEVVKQGRGYAWVKPRTPQILDKLRQITGDLKRIVEEEKKKQNAVQVDNTKS